MRITDGTLRRKRLRPADGGTVRPTARRLRETLFDFLAPRVAGAHFLDLCAGTGAVGIEALSRGAAHVTFVECDRAACTLIDTNLTACGIARAQVAVVADDAASFLQRAGAAQTWDIAYFDPPYTADYASVLTHFAAGAALRRKGSVLVVEHHCEHRLDDVLGKLQRWRVIRQGQSCLSFYERRR
jgi:16S rRNA (guanine966-N2)-methyltransferase